MNIALISFWSCPLTQLGVLNSGGMSVYIRNFAAELAKLGHFIDIYTRVHKNGNHSIVSLHPHIRLIHIKNPSLNLQKKDLYDSVIPFSQNILAFIKEHDLKYDSMYSHYFYSGLVSKKLKNSIHLPLVHTFHTLSKMKEVYAGVIDKRRFEAEIEVVTNTDSIIASTDLEKHDLIKYYGADKKKIYIVEPGVNHNVFKPYDQRSIRRKLSLPTDKKIILFVGRIDPLKGIKLLIESMSLLVKRDKTFAEKVHLLLIGGDISSRHFWQNPEVVNIKNLIIDRNLDCCVKFLGSMPHHLLPKYYSSSDVVVLPSAYESFGFVVLEAMACGKVVVASRVGGLRYLIRDGTDGRLFKSGDDIDLANKLWEVLNDEKERLRLGTNAYHSSQKFCWNKQVLKIERVFKAFI